ncbi:hypothetical protein Cgig2_030819 [Carnegiea gigantea]|uniref:Uncharacterized protein n=1 Tax=Carnegiea gigantea TaxID=171969 RepID=A0A9Q1GT61_9CARY|nr:hypothetical protein Cgig2_030819 [Carnegiea gigantea]
MCCGGECRPLAFILGLPFAFLSLLISIVGIIIWIPGLLLSCICPCCLCVTVLVELALELIKAPLHNIPLKAKKLKRNGSPNPRTTAHAAPQPTGSATLVAAKREYNPVVGDPIQSSTAKSILAAMKVKEEMRTDRVKVKQGRRYNSCDGENMWTTKLPATTPIRFHGYDGDGLFPVSQEGFLPTLGWRDPPIDPIGVELYKARHGRLLLVTSETDPGRVDP